MKRSIQKRSFLLFEVLCSLALIACVLFPLLKPCFWSYKQRKEDLRVRRRALIESEAFTQLKTKLYLHEISFELLQKGTFITFCVDQTLCKAKLQPLEETHKPSLHKIGLLMEIELTIDHQTTTHTLFIEGVTL